MPFMATTLLKISALLLAMGIWIQGSCGQCFLSNITVSQRKTGELKDLSEYAVQISNNCICSQSALTLTCDGFDNAKNIDPSILKKDGDHCLVNNGFPMFRQSPIKFNYSSIKQLELVPVSSQINCS